MNFCDEGGGNNKIMPTENVAFCRFVAGTSIARKRQSQFALGQNGLLQSP